MNAEISILPAPVAAELSGAGSFFGSCQIAASGFDDFLATAEDFTEFEMAIQTQFAENFNENKVLKQLQSILGEEAGVEAFENINDFIKKYKPFEQKADEDSKYLEIMQTFLFLLETPGEEQKIKLEICLK